MSTDLLQRLCKGFCAIAQIATPELHAQDDGVIAFNIVWRGVSVDIMAKPSASADHAFALFELGQPNPTQADPARALLALMHINFLSLRVNQPVFSCHPGTNAAVLQVPVPLDSTPALLHRMIEEGVHLALQWREGLLMPQLDAEPDPVPADAMHGSFA